MTNQQKSFVLIGLFVAWGGMTAYQMMEFSDPSSNQLSPTAPQGNSTLPSVTALSLDPSFPNSRKTVTFSHPRNIFAPLSSPATKTKPQDIKEAQPTATLSTPSIPTPVSTGPSPENLAIQRAQQQLKKFRFLGYLTKGGESQAFLTNGQAIYIVKQGEMLEGQVQVHEIEPDTIVLSTKVWETGNQVQATIPLTPEAHSS